MTRVPADFLRKTDGLPLQGVLRRDVVHVALALKIRVENVARDRRHLRAVTRALAHDGDRDLRVVRRGVADENAVVVASTWVFSP